MRISPTHRASHAVAGELRPPLVIAALVVGGFAIFHGHAHGTELPAGQSALLYNLEGARMSVLEPAPSAGAQKGQPRK